MNAFEKIEKQQAGKEYTDIWMVGEQLKEILKADPSLEELVSKDLDAQGMSLAAAAAKVKDWADAKHKETKGNCVCVPPSVADGIIREFYGLPAVCVQETSPELPPEDDAPLDFSDFL